MDQFLELIPQDLKSELATARRRWLVTGAAGFIGSGLSSTLLAAGQDVVGFDNFSTGFQSNIDWLIETSKASGEIDRKARGMGERGISEKSLETGRANFEFLKGDLADLDACRRAVEGVDFVMHLGALGSVPRSIAKPQDSFQSNVVGFHNLLLALKDLKRPPRMIFSSSSSVYGDSTEMPKREGSEGRPLSPYAFTKKVNEDMARLYSEVFGLPLIGLRYFNVFGPRQNPNGPYAAVIPLWITSLLKGEVIRIHGDGLQSRDFTFVGNVIQANLRAALQGENNCYGKTFNIAAGRRTTLLDLLQMIVTSFRKLGVDRVPEVVHGPSRAGDVPHSLASIDLARKYLGYEPTVQIESGVDKTVAWYLNR